MKNLLLAAALLTTAAAPALANPVHLFSINTTNPRSIDFKGTGTANFNNSTGTQNNFNVGSSTNLGVNGSINATRDYGGTSDGTLQLAGTSVMQQTIGTSGNAANVQAASQAAGLAAYTSANQYAKKQADDNFGTGYDASKVATYQTKEIDSGEVDANGNAIMQTVADLNDDGSKKWTNLSDQTYRKADGSVLSVDDISSEQDWIVQKDTFERSKFNSQYASDYATTLEQSQMVGTWKHDVVKSELEATKVADQTFGKDYASYLDLYAADQITDTNAKTSTSSLTQDQWEAARDKFITSSANLNKYNQNGISLAEFSAAQGGESSSSEEQFGVIKGDFKTTNSASTGSTGSHQEWIDSARAAADGLMGANFDRRSEGSNVQAQTGDSSKFETVGGIAVETSDDWKTEWDKAFANAYSASQAESTYNQSESTVTVTGVGNIANVNASGQSKFNVNLSPREIPSYDAQVAALNGSLIKADGTVINLGINDQTAGTAVTAQPIIFPEENGSASGSSGASLGTSSYANQSNSESASAFIQAFAASNTNAPAFQGNTSTTPADNTNPTSTENVD